MIEKNMLIKYNNTIIRILAIEDDKAYVIDCIARTMPRWIRLSEIGTDICTEEELSVAIGIVPSEEELSAEEKVTARSRYNLVAGVLPFLTDDKMRNAVIKKISESNQISRKTLTNYLCTYLAFGNVYALARKKKVVPVKL